MYMLLGVGMDSWWVVALQHKEPCLALCDDWRDGMREGMLCVIMTDLPCYMAETNRRFGVGILVQMVTANPLIIQMQNGTNEYLPYGFFLLWQRFMKPLFTHEILEKYTNFQKNFLPPSLLGLYWKIRKAILLLEKLYSGKKSLQIWYFVTLYFMII